MSHAAGKGRLPPTRHHVLSLYRRLLQQSATFKGLSFSLAGVVCVCQFRANRGVQDVSQLSRLYQSGLSQLAVLQRQTTVHNLYHHQPYIIETVKGAEGQHAGRGWRLKKQGQDATAGEIEGDAAKEKEQLTTFTYNAHDSH